jgi:NYN domain
MTGPQGTTALFIDADNVPISCLATILDLLSPEWTPIKIRAYGTQLLQRYPPLREIGVMPVEVIPVVPGKNAVDLVLTVDAMEELYSGHADSISIASGDSDFTHLIMKIRESGKPVLAFGHLLTPVALQKAATNFYFVEPGLDNSLIRRMRARLLADNVRLSPNLNRDELLKFRLNQLIEEMRRTKERARLAELSAMLKLIHPHFSPKAYGSASLTKLLKQLGFHLEPILGQDGRIQDYELASDS